MGTKILLKRESVIYFPSFNISKSESTEFRVCLVEEKKEEGKRKKKSDFQLFDTLSSLFSLSLLQNSIKSNNTIKSNSVR